jgi:mannose-6-phosphate isomerase
MTMYPMLLQPALHTRVWGGHRLADQLHKKLPTDEPYGESWELHDSSVVLNGTFAGKSLGELVKSHGAELIGAQNNPDEGFPLLAKFLDAADWLSIQVHPDDKFAVELEGQPRGKTEAWYVVDASPGAKLVLGVQSGTPREAIASAIQDNTLDKLVVYAEVKTGDGLYMPAGTIHALGPGLLIYEIQQSSDVTYRLYDWGRMGLDGKPRALHIEKSLIVANTASLPPILHPADTTIATVFEGAYFRTLRHHLHDATLTLNTDGRVFHALSCIEGQASVSAGETTILLQIGQTALIPAAVGQYQMAGSGLVLNSMQKPG